MLTDKKTHGQTKDYLIEYCRHYKLIVDISIEKRCIILIIPRRKSFGSPEPHCVQFLPVFEPCH